MASGATPTPDRPYVPGLPGRLLGAAYSAVVARRNARFDAGRAVITLDRPVISVGNLSLGGTGKTPMVQRIVALLREHGHDPCIAMRGYASRAARGRSDEADLHRARFDDLPVVAQPDRVEGLIKLFHTERGERVDCVVLDDGFQHRRIARQLDLVLLDAAHDAFASAVFPAGRLREPAANMRRATHIAVTHAEQIGQAHLDALLARTRAAAPDAPLAVSEHRWCGLLVTPCHRDRPCDLGASGAAPTPYRHLGASGKSDRDEPVSWLAGKRVVAACAIARPDPFLAALRASGAHLAEAITLRDHDPFNTPTVERITSAATRSGAEAIVITEKDWTKLAHKSIAWPCPIARARLSLEFRSGWDRLAADILAIAAEPPDA